jgi:hypothetical protein
LTATGLGALGLGERELSQFGREFRQGMAHPERSAALGDVADEGPEVWEFGGPSTATIDALCLTFARTREQLDDWARAREQLFARYALSFHAHEAQALAGPPGSALRASPTERRRQRVPLGEFVLGERDVLAERRRGPFVPVKYGTRPMPNWSRREQALDFGQNGSYLVLRKLERSAPIAPGSYADLSLEHARHALGPESSRSHRLLRRSRKLANGLWFMALNADIRRQFEFVQQSQCNVPGPKGELDPFVGRSNGRSVGEARHFRVRGGAYFFLPSLRALNYLAEPGG